MKIVIQTPDDYNRCVDGVLTRLGHIDFTLTQLLQSAVTRNVVAQMEGKTEPIVIRDDENDITITVTDTDENTDLAIEINDDGALADDQFQMFRSVIRVLSEDQCRKAMRQLILGQSTDSAEMAMFARIADYLAFGEKYSDMPRETALEAFKASLTVDKLRDMWNQCDF